MLYPLFKRFLEQQSLLACGQGVVAAVSGGIDSMVMLNLLARLARTRKISITVAHVNHGLRGRDSDADEALVRKQAGELGLRFCSERLVPPKGKNLQDAARRLRQGFLARTAKSVGAEAIALAHHRGDQAETILMHLIRGAGLAGISGMRPCSRRGDVELIRPLLFATRAEIERYAREERVPFREDASNAKVLYRRNSLRLDLLPKLREYNPRIEEALCLLGARAADAEAFISDFAKAAFEKALISKTTSSIAWDRGVFVSEPPAVRAPMLRHAFACVTGSLADLNADQTQRMMAIAMGEKGSGEYRLPASWCFVRRGKRLCIQKKALRTRVVSLAKAPHIR